MSIRIFSPLGWKGLLATNSNIFGPFVHYDQKCLMTSTAGLLRLRRRMPWPSGEVVDGDEDVSGEADGPGDGRALHHLRPVAHARVETRHSRQGSQSGWVFFSLSRSVPGRRRCCLFFFQWICGETIPFHCYLKCMRAHKFCMAALSLSVCLFFRFVCLSVCLSVLLFSTISVNAQSPSRQSYLKFLTTFIYLSVLETCKRTCKVSFF